ncbi:ABC transporter ATP-binding protein [Anopheles sinensis]|uniref:ABC transporter ATP-binding protein n=1 Tax=Anopheles sinensis TaxID=74873 RepID=A0A084VYK0_ANOSI|nr:ABC transporter ATP-binding protein [Anopheles sinensis]
MTTKNEKTQTYLNISPSSIMVCLEIIRHAHTVSGGTSARDDSHMPRCIASGATMLLPAGSGVSLNDLRPEGGRQDRDENRRTSDPPCTRVTRSPGSGGSEEEERTLFLLTPFSESEDGGVLFFPLLVVFVATPGSSGGPDCDEARKPLKPTALIKSSSPAGRGLVEEKGGNSTHNCHGIRNV